MYTISPCCCCDIYIYIQTDVIYYILMYKMIKAGMYLAWWWTNKWNEIKLIFQKKNRWWEWCESRVDVKSLVINTLRPELKCPTILVMIYSNSNFLNRNFIVLWCEFYSVLFQTFQLIRSQCGFKKWVGAEQAPNHYLKQWWPGFLMYICITRPQWVNQMSLSVVVILLSIEHWWKKNKKNPNKLGS